MIISSRVLASTTSESKWRVAMVWALSLGLFIQLSGKIWLESTSARNAQVYIWLLAPALIYCVHKIISRSLRWPDWQYVPWLLYLLWVALSTLWATDADAGAWSLAKRGLFIGLYLMAIHCLMTQHQWLLRRALLTAVAVIALSAAVSLVYQFGVLDRPLSFRGYRIDRLGIGNFANFGWPVAAGIFHGAVATWALGVALDKRTRPALSLFWLAAFVALAGYVLLTYTRGAWIALAVCCILIVVIQNSRRGWLVLAAVVLVALVAIILSWDHLLLEVQRRQLSGRAKIWEYFYAAMTDHWTIGYGLGTPFRFVWPNEVAISPHAHSLYLQQIYDSGIVSLALMCAGLLGLTYKAWQLRSHPWVQLAFPALVFALIAMLTDVERIFTRPGDYWTVFWLPVAVLLAVPSRRKTEDKPPVSDGR